MNKDCSALNILFVQDSSPCIRTIKYSTALKSNGHIVHLVHRDKDPLEAYGYGNESFASISKLPSYKFFDLRIIRRIIADLKIDLVHYHNQPDILGAKLISGKLGVPVIYDQHDFMSFKHRIRGNAKKSEQTCNEKADGAVYITDTYRNEVAKYYNLVQNTICFANYFPRKAVLNSCDALPKLSQKNDNCYAVYIGRISEHESEHRNIIKEIAALSETGLQIHIYPSKNKEYPQYRCIKNVTMHERLPYNKLIREISQYDFGLTMFHETGVAQLPHIKFALGNKTFDYLCSGIPVLVQNKLDDARDFVLNNGFGFIMENQDEYMKLSKDAYKLMVEHIQKNRYKFSMEERISDIIAFYRSTLQRFHAKA